MHRLLEHAIEEGIFDIKLVDGPITRDSNRDAIPIVAGLTTGLNVSSMPGC